MKLRSKLNVFAICLVIPVVLILGTIFVFVMERQAELFYRQFEKRAYSEDLKRLCRRLADEENEHLKVIETILDRWRSLPPVPMSAAILEGDKDLKNLFRCPPDEAAGIEVFAAYAIREERKMVDFYANFEKEFTHAWKLNRLRDMIAEEKEHVKVWTDLFSA